MLSKTVLDEVQRLNDLATDFLELSRLESGRVRLKREPVHLGGLVQECLEVLRPQAAVKQINLEIEVDPAVTPVHGDRSLLKQMLLNFLTNAIKYNRGGGMVETSIRKHNEEVIVAVRDTGIGMDAEDLEHLFERFYRAPGVDEGIPGSGLGLVIAKRIAESHLGRVDVQSEPGEGSTFSVYLPASVPGEVSTRPRS